MSSNTVAQFAIELKMPANVLLEQLRGAGVDLKSVDDNVTDGDKARLLESLRRSHGATEGKKITLTRRQTTEIRQADGSGKSRTIQVEVRKKRVFVKRDTPETTDAAPVAAVPVEPAVPAADVSALATPSVAEQTPDIPQTTAQTPDVAVSAQTAETAAPAEITPTETVAAAPASEPAAEPVAVPETTPEVAPEPVAAAPAVETPVNLADQVPSESADAAKTTAKTARGRAVTPAHLEGEAGVRDEARRASEAEAAALRDMLNKPRKIVRAESDPAALSGTLHKPAAAKAGKKEGTTDAPGKKTLKSGEIASTWSDDASRKKPAEKRDAPAAPGREGWRAGGKSKSGGRKGGRGANNTQTENREPVPVEFIAREIHVPETISVADLSHKMSIKAGEVIKHLMQLGQIKRLR